MLQRWHLNWQSAAYVRLWKMWQCDCKTDSSAPMSTQLPYSEQMCMTFTMKARFQFNVKGVCDNAASILRRARSRYEFIQNNKCWRAPREFTCHVTSRWIPKTGSLWSLFKHPLAPKLRGQMRRNHDTRNFNEIHNNYSA